MVDVTAVQKTILAQTMVVAQQAAASALAAAQAANIVASRAPIDSPVFTGTPQAPTPADNDNSTKLATTAYLDRLRAQPSGLATLDNTGKIPTGQIPPLNITAVYTVASQAAMLALAAGVGNIAIRTDLSNAEFILTALPASTLGNWTQIGTAPVLSVAGLVGAIAANDLLTALAAAPLASPALTGTPTAPTVAGAVDSSTKIATTAFVQAVAALLAPKASPTFTGTPTVPTATIDTNTGQAASTAFVLGQGSQSGDGNPAMDGSAARGTSTHFARADHVHPTDTSRAPLDSPAFTGSPTTPTPGTNVNTAQVVNGAWVNSFFQTLAGMSAYAPLASPAFSGNPTAPTQTGTDNSTRLATTAFVQAAIAGFTPGQPIPTNSTLGIGTAVYLQCSGTVADGATIAGSNLVTMAYRVDGSASLPGTAQTGTWKNITGAVISSGSQNYGYFVRIA